MKKPLYDKLAQVAWTPCAHFESCIGFCPYCGTKYVLENPVEAEQLWNKERTQGTPERYAVLKKMVERNFPALVLRAGRARFEGYQYGEEAKPELIEKFEQRTAKLTVELANEGLLREESEGRFVLTDEGREKAEKKLF